jgi:hypothetical protein
MTKRRPFSVAERIVLRDLNAADDGLSAYTFWRRYKIGPALLFRAVQRLAGEGLVTIDGSFFRITANGRNEVVDNRWAFLHVRDRPWRDCPKEFTQPPLKPNGPYIPRWTQVAPEILPQSYQQIVRNLHAKK